MELWEIFLIGIGLSMDAFAVSVCKGLSIKQNIFKSAIIIALYFACFQAVMPLIGFLLGNTLHRTYIHFSHLIAFFFLSFLGIKMVKDSCKEESKYVNKNLNFSTMILLSIATSIDALTVGITFAFFQINILKAIVIIGIITFLLSFLGVKIGNLFGSKFQNKSQLLGGIILILIGIKMLLDHIGIFS